MADVVLQENGRFHSQILAKEQLGKALENPATQFSGRDDAQKVYDTL